MASFKSRSYLGNERIINHMDSTPMYESSCTTTIFIPKETTKKKKPQKSKRLIAHETKLKMLRSKSIAHYTHMIRVVEALVKVSPYFAKMKPSNDQMLDISGEDFSSDFCVYCRTFNNEYTIDSDTCVESCPLSTKSSGSCCDGLYEKMKHARTWTQWIDRAKDVRDFIKSHGIDSRKFK